MKTLVIISIVILLLIIIFANTIFSKVDISENFDSISYSDCLSKGYTKEFCGKTSVSFMGPSICTCSDGSIGTIMPGFRGGCICNKNGTLF